jgi:hypothetical protein
MTPFPTLHLDYKNQTLTQGMIIKLREVMLRLCRNLSPKLRDYNTSNLRLQTKAKSHDNVGPKN